MVMTGNKSFLEVITMLNSVVGRRAKFGIDILFVGCT